MKKFSIIFSFILLFFVALSTSSFAANYQAVKDVVVDTNLKYKHYFIFDNTLVFLCTDTQNANGSFPYIRKTATVDNDGFFRLYPGSYQIFRYELDENGKWVNGSRLLTHIVNAENYQSGFYDYNTSIAFSANSDFKASSLPIKQYDYETTTWSVVFQPTPADWPPLAEVTQALIAEEAPKAQSQVLGTMNILLLCGVGCLAFLMVLVLFGKVFHRFQVL